MKKTLIGLTLLTAVVSSSAATKNSVSSSVDEHKNLKAFPMAAKDFSRTVIVLPHKERKEEKNYSVELIVGKVIKTDGVNLFGMNTSLKAMPLKGWGFTFYNMQGNDSVRSTMMAPAADQPKVDKFVGGKPLKIRYNSRIPIVIYTPEGFEVRYRIWKATADFKKATK